MKTLNSFIFKKYTVQKQATKANIAEGTNWMSDRLVESILVDRLNQ